MRPGETTVFCARIAFAISSTERSYAVSIAGSIQTRIAAGEPKICTRPTPGTRFTSSRTVRDRKSPSSVWLTRPSGERSERIMRKPEVEVRGCRPICRTICGRRGSTVRMRFWTSTCAMSGSTPGSKVAVSCALPEVSAEDS